MADQTVLSPPCGGCGGPYRFDTSIPSATWNKVIRAAGMSEYLCTTCVVEAFAKAGVSFTAELYGESVNRGDGTVPTIAVQVGTVPFGDTEGDREALVRERVHQDAYAEGYAAAIAWHREMATHLRDRAKQIREEWCGPDVSDEDNRDNYKSAREDEQKAGWHRDCADVLAERAEAGRG